jgi:hypothetical protein
VIAAAHARGQVALQLVRSVAIAGEVVAVGQPLAEEDVHDAAGERSVGAGAQRQVHVRGLRGPRPVGIDDDEPRPPLLPGAGDVGHQVDVGVDRVAAPDDDEIRVLGHLGRRHPPAPPVPGLEAGVGERHADRALEARVALGVGEALDPVALHEAHRAGVPVGPDRLGPVAALGGEERLGDPVQRLVPADPGEVPRALGARAHQRVREPVGVVEALAVAGDLGADHARRVGDALAAPDLAEAAVGQPLDLQRADRRAVVGADGGAELAHRPMMGSRVRRRNLAGP